MYQNFDHHCPWVSNCVGRNNYRLFVWFVTMVVFNCVVMLVVSLRLVIHASNASRDSGIAALIDALIDSDIRTALAVGGGVFLAFYSFYAVWSVSGLCGYHVHISSQHITTHESMMRWNEDTHNPRDRGVWHNFLWTWCAPRYPSFWPPERRVWLNRCMYYEWWRRAFYYTQRVKALCFFELCDACVLQPNRFCEQTVRLRATF